MGDIVAQMTKEMQLTPDMLNSMQQQQQMYPDQNQPNFAQYSPEQQMQMMQMQSQMPPQSQQPFNMPVDSDSDTDSEASAEMDLDKLGLNGTTTGFTDVVMKHLQDPLVIIVLFVLLNLTQVDQLLKPILPAMLSVGLYFTGIKGLLAGLGFLLLKLVVV